MSDSDDYTGSEGDSEVNPLYWRCVPLYEC